MLRWLHADALVRAVVLIFMVAPAGATRPMFLENECVRIDVDPTHGGAVTGMLYKKGIRFQFIADRGAGVAGSGLLFVPVIKTGGKSFTLAGVPMRVEAGSGSSSFTLSASLAGLAPGLSLERMFRTSERESGFSVQEVLRNDSGRDIEVRLGAVSRQKSEPWRLTGRFWIGDAGQVLDGRLGGAGKDGLRMTVSGNRFFWRQVEQYGTGFLYRLGDVKAGINLAASSLAEPGHPLEVTWEAEPVIVPGHGRVTVRSTVLIDEGGGAPDQRNAFAPVLVRSDMAAAGRSGEPMTGFATVVSPVARRARVVVTQSQNDGSARREVVRADVQLVPGRTARIPVTLTPRGKAGLCVRSTVLDASGSKLADAEVCPVIDGVPAARSGTWNRYTSRMPEEHYAGTWQEIGEQLVRNTRRIGWPTSVEVSRGQARMSGSELSFYAKHFPFYSELLAGAAKAAGLRVSEVALMNHALAERSACMDVAFYGPDGPINAFSKERGEETFKGLGYIKVLPAHGYPFHLYMNYGVNSEGLSTSGATLNEDERTTNAGNQAATAWKQSGKHVMPSSVWMWMLLSMCRNVDEALAMITNSDAPLELTGNLLLLDRFGNAARVESAGIIHQVFRRNPGEQQFFVAGNYPHRRADGLFAIGRHWGQAANTMLRERFLEDVAGRRAGSIGLRDVVSLMQAHEAGGMCQHIYDNPAELLTSCSSIAVTKTSELWLSQGPPCQVQYIRHTLKP